jgi:DNA-binding transcriptional MerR regulator
MAKTSKLHQYAVLWLHSQAMDINAIANETGLSIKQIEAVVNKNTTDKNQNSAIASNHSPVKSKAHQLMINESVGKRQKVSIMTKETSQIADEDRKKHTETKKNNNSYIFRPSESN